MNKKIIISLSVIALVAGVALGVTGAYFTDTAESEGNTFSAGTLELSLSERGDQDFSVTFDDMAPGEWTSEQKLLLVNTGSLPLVVDQIQVSDLNYTRGDASVNWKEFAENLNVRIKKSGTGWFTNKSLRHLYTGSGGHNQLGIPSGEEITLNQDGYGAYYFQFQLDENADNDFQGGSIDATFEVEAVQEGQE